MKGFIQVTNVLCVQKEVGGKVYWEDTNTETININHIVSFKNKILKDEKQKAKNRTGGEIITIIGYVIFVKESEGEIRNLIHKVVQED